MLMIETLSPRNSTPRLWCNIYSKRRWRWFGQQNEKNTLTKKLPIWITLSFGISVWNRLPPSSKVTQVSCVMFVCVSVYLCARLISVRFSAWFCRFEVNVAPSLCRLFYPFFVAVIRAHKHTQLAHTVSSTLDKLYVVCYARRL